ncbi:MAG: hypothetical protein ACHBN1_07435 [Heteroscytonema crispum UTEX LB 1556]
MASRELHSVVDNHTAENPPENFSDAESVEKSLIFLTEDVKPQLPSLQIQPYRMNIVVDNFPPLNKPSFKSVLFSPTKVITTGILASGGLLTWFNWHRFTPTPSQPHEQPTLEPTLSLTLTLTPSQPPSQPTVEPTP